jgi:ABC-type multidrug transport system fused ATPase/permease subunit
MQVDYIEKQYGGFMGLRESARSIMTAGRGKNVDIETLRRVLILNALIIPGAFFALVLGIIAVSDGNPALAAADGAFLLVQILMLILLRTASNLELPVNLAIITLFVFFLILAVLGGREGTAVTWVLLYPPICASLAGTRKGIIFPAVFLLLITAVFALQNTLSFITAEYTLAFQIRLTAVYITITLLSLIGEELRNRIHERLKKSNQEKEEAIQKLNKSLREIKTLQGILPICLHCKKIRDDDGYWQAVDQYIHTRTDVRFSHALCPECMKKHYPEYTDENPTE